MAFLLREYEPSSLEPLNDHQRQLITNDLSNWTAWASGCPELSPFEQMPMDTSVNAKKLLHWVQSLDESKSHFAGNHSSNQMNQMNQLNQLNQLNQKNRLVSERGKTCS